ncbi:hypothetical protein U8C32_13880 [Sinorhizobium medicae]|uniref:hypothetical protein n=1 Tax=Sinorhizobium medicae TaxID=110321 RepID=UPI002AF6B90F|nr:hypothetical protein [Sinorhizobium medicae]WQO94007.1 hypothetical protein U8C32_13880 [Sinorhizobium medicae]
MTSSTAVACFSVVVTKRRISLTVLSFGIQPFKGHSVFSTSDRMPALWSVSPLS